MKRFGWVCLSLLVGTAAARADMVTVGAAQSTTLYSESGNSNGQGTSMFAGRTNAGSVRRSLARFDVAGALPAGATITSVSLQLTLSNVPNPAGTAAIGLHVLNGEWGEGASTGTGNGGPATVGDATWTKRVFNTIDWTTPGGDFAPAASASTAVVGAKDSAVTWSSSQLTVDVQSWLDNPAQNFGWALVNANEATIAASVRGFYTEEFGGSFAPALTIHYDVATVPEPSSIGLIAGCVAGGAWRRFGRRRGEASHA